MAHRTLGRLVGRFAGLVVAAVVVAGCATTHEGPEPGAVVLRNGTAGELSTMTVREPRPRTPKPVRMGFVSPLAAGAEAEFVRTPDADRLPAQGLVEWSTPDGRRFDAAVDIASALRDATGEPGERLVFEVGPGGAVSVRVEKPGG
jgi:hypothetical protein